MFKAAIKSLLGHKLRLVTTAIAVLLGVSFMAASFVLTDTVSAAFKGVFSDTTKNIDAVVQAKTVFKSDNGFGQDPPVSSSVVSTVKTRPEVRNAEGYVLGLAILNDKAGKPTTDLRKNTATIGMNWPTISQFNHFELVSGRSPVGPNDVVIDNATAQKFGFKVGDPITMNSLQGKVPNLRVVGIAKFNGANTYLGQSFVVMETDAASTNFVGKGLVSKIYVLGRTGVAQTDLAASIRKVIPDTTEVLTGKDYTASLTNQIQTVLNIITTIFVGFSLLSLLISIFLISNTFSIIVAQRTRELALLRALGASRKQVTRSVLLEALAIGITASAIGAVLGIGMATLLKAGLGAIGATFPDGPTIVKPRTLIITPLVGLVVTMVSAVLPARRAARVPPVAAMREATVDESSRSNKRRIFGFVLLVAGIAGLLSGAASATPSQAGLGGAFTLVAVIVLGPVLVPPVGRLIGLLLTQFGITGRLARENAVRNPKRTASTATALTISLMLVGTLMILVSSFVGTINSTFEKRFIGNFEVDTGQFRGTGASPLMARKIAAVPEVAAVSGVRAGQIRAFDSVKDVSFVDPATIEKIVDTGVSAGSLSKLDATTIAVNQKIAKAHNLAVGSPVQVEWANGTKVTMKVGAIFENASTITQNDDPYLLGIPAAEKFLPPGTGDLRVLVTTKPGADKEASRQAIEAAIKRDFPQAKVLDKVQVKDQAAKNFNQFLSFFLILLGLSVVIGLLGIVNTMLLSIFERTRELGLLRAVGMKRRQLGSSIAMESVIIALLGTSLGMLVGLGLGAAVITSVRDQLNNAQIVFPWGQLVAVFILTVIIGVLAAALPARRAMRLDVLDAIDME